MSPRYNVNVFWYTDDECWVADVPDLGACSAFGATPEEALREVQVAMQGWLQAAEANGIAIPEPRYQPSSYAERFAA